MFWNEYSHNWPLFLGWRIPEFHGWEDVRPSESDVNMDVQVDSSQLPLTTNEEGEQVGTL